MTFAQQLMQQLSRLNESSSESSELAKSMTNAPAYEDWTDEDIKTFASSAPDWTVGQGNAAMFLKQQEISANRASEAAMADRGRVVAEIDQLRAGMGEEWINASLSRERSYHDAKINDAVTQIQQQYAQLGRTPSPMVLAQVQRNMAIEAGESLQLTRMRLEQQRQDALIQLTGLKNNVFQSTQRQVIDPATAYSVAQQMAG